MKNIYALSLFIGIVSVPLFFISLLPIAVSQLGNPGSTSEVSNFLVFALLILLFAVGGCLFVMKDAKSHVSLQGHFGIILMQVLFSAAFYILLILCSKLIFAILPQEQLQNSSGGDTTTKQAIQWMAVLLPLLFQHALFWWYMTTRYPR